MNRLECDNMSLLYLLDIINCKNKININTDKERKCIDNVMIKYKKFIKHCIKNKNYKNKFI